jgi:hypothetical protein
MVATATGRTGSGSCRDRWCAGSGPRGLTVTTAPVLLSAIFGAYRSFLRIKVERDGGLTIYPAGVRRVPGHWRLVRDRAPHEPAFEPTDRPLETHLIEAPIRIDP